MKITHILSISIFTLLSACGNSTDTADSFPTDAKDFMFAGNPGTEIVMTSTHSETDTTGREHTSPVITYVFTIMERDVLHPFGGKSIRMRQEGRLANSNPSVNDSVYFSFYNNSIVRFNSIRDTAYGVFLKNPLIVGTKWDEGVTVKSVGEIVNTTFKPLKAVMVEGISTSISSYDSVTHARTTRLYFAPEVCLAKNETRVIRTYPNKKTALTIDIADLVQYNKK